MSSPTEFWKYFAITAWLWYVCLVLRVFFRIFLGELPSPGCAPSVGVCSSNIVPRDAHILCGVCRHRAYFCFGSFELSCFLREQAGGKEYRASFITESHFIYGHNFFNFFPEDRGATLVSQTILIFLLLARTCMERPLHTPF